MVDEQHEDAGAGAAVGTGRGWAIFDIDGVLADVRHRLHHLGRRPPDWPGFFADAADDPPVADGVALARELAGTHLIGYFTGRPERLRAVTQRWLDAEALPAGPLRMRGRGDHRPARLVKLELLMPFAEQGHIDLVVDDDEEVVVALRSAGLTVRQARWVPGSRRLHRAQERDGRT